MDSECAVCYCEQATCKLVCNHSFCKTCVKTWYQKSDEPTCPMCRRVMYFKGLHKLSEKWEDERIEKLNEEAFNTAFDAIFEEGSDYSESEEDSESDSDWETSSEYSEESTWDEGDTHILFNDPKTWKYEESSSPRSMFQFPDGRQLPGYVLRSDSLSESESSEVESEFGNGNYLIDSIIKLQAAYQKALRSDVDIPSYLEDDNYLFFDIDEGDTGNFVTEDDVFSHEKNLFVSKHSGMIQNKRTGSRVPPKGDNSYTIVFLVEC